MTRFYPPSAHPSHWTTDRGITTPADFGDPLAEYHTLMAKVAWVDFSHPGVVALSGPDHLDFLGGLITNQVRHVSATRSIHASLLTPQGRYLWDFTLVEEKTGTEPARVLLVTEPDRVPELIQQMAFYRLRAKVQISDEGAAFHLLGLVGPETDQAIGSLFPGLGPLDAALGTTVSPETGLRLWRDPRHEKFGWRLLLPATQWRTMSERMATRLPPAGWTAWEAYRLHHALPRGGNEMIPQETLPLEAGLWEMNGVDFGKGCYVGQETTARTHHRATLKKRLFQVAGPPGVNWPPGTTVHRPDGQEIGVVTSHCPLTGTALALLRLAEVAHTEGSLRIQGQPVTATKPSWAAWT